MRLWAIRPPPAIGTWSAIGDPGRCHLGGRRLSDKRNEALRALRLSMACNHGRELVKHAEQTRKTGTVSDLNSPWPWDSNENASGPPWQCLSKRKALCINGQDEIGELLHTWP